jgi:hypothetical protein
MEGKKQGTSFGVLAQ